MALTKASDVLGLRKKIEEFAVPIESLSASKVSVDLPGYTATNAAGAFEEIDLNVSQLSASVLTIGEKIENISEYTTTEKEIGKWIDGSTIYQKTYSGVMPTITENVFATALIDTTADNIDLVIDYDIFTIQVFDGKQVTVKLPYMTNTGLQLKGFYDGNNKNINVSSNAAAYSEKVFYATLRYIKAASQETKKKTTKKRG